ncbi:outer membrane protein assembly factor BamA [Verrucomicrobiota bacterium]|nr:outer membrane protein assembly factor BamA [Verrucomicrobiota bacterium]
MPKPVARRFLLSACLLLATLAAHAQTPEEKVPNVRTISVKGQNGVVSEAFVRGFVALRPGQPFDKDAVASTIRALYATGRFTQASVQPNLDPRTGEVDVEVVVEPRPLILSINFREKSDLIDLDSGFLGSLELEGIKLGEPLDPPALRRAELKLQTELRKRRPFATVTSDVTTFTRGATLVIKVVDIEKFRVDAVRLEGAVALPAQQVIDDSEVKSSVWTWWKLPALSGVGYLDPEEYHKDCLKIRDYYRSQGFLDIEVTNDEASKACVRKDLVDGSGWLEVVFRVKEGRRYSVGSLQFEGNRMGAANPIFGTEALQRVVREASLRRGARPEANDHLLAGAWYSTATVEAAADKLREYYGQMGYLGAQVNVVRRPNLATGAIDLRFVIEEGERFSVRAIEIQGNTKTRFNVIARELALGPGEVFDLARMRVSEARLRNTQFFEEVRLTPVPTSVPGQNDLRITVKEGNTGSISFGAGYSTVEQLVGYVEYSEGNFDYTNPEGWYRGAGQKLRARVSLGSVSSSLEHSFEEPALWDRDLALGYKLERRYAGYQSTNYSVITEGVGVYARRRIFGTVEGRLAYDLRRISVSNVTALAPADVQLENGRPRTISSVTASFVHDTRDEYNFPTKGSRISLTEELAGNGLGGKVDYLKSELRAGKWFLLSTTAEQTLAVIGRVGVLTGTGGTLPFYERFYLGGAYDMRGFDYNDVGAYDTYDHANGVEQPMGGLTYGYFTAEYTIKAAGNMRFAAFYDYGLVNRSEADFGLASANSDCGLGMRILLGGAVMRLDFGFPLKSTLSPAGTPVNKGAMKFNFSFGTVF